MAAPSPGPVPTSSRWRGSVMSSSFACGRSDRTRAGAPHRELAATAAIALGDARAHASWSCTPRRPVAFSRRSAQSLPMADAEIPVLRGRRDERAVLDGLLDEARGGGSGVLVLRGDAGIGKTALLEYARESAPDFKLLRSAGAESEMELAFAALHQLCAPL